MCVNDKLEWDSHVVWYRQTIKMINKYYTNNLKWNEYIMKLKYYLFVINWKFGTLVTIDVIVAYVETTITLPCPCFRPHVCIAWKIKTISLEVIKTIIGSVEVEQLSQLDRKWCQMCYMFKECKSSHNKSGL